MEKFKNYEMTTESDLPNFSNPFDGDTRARPPQSQQDNSYVLLNAAGLPVTSGDQTSQGDSISAPSPQEKFDPPSNYDPRQKLPDQVGPMFNDEDEFELADVKDYLRKGNRSSNQSSAKTSIVTGLDGAVDPF